MLYFNSEPVKYPVLSGVIEKVGDDFGYTYSDELRLYRVLTEAKITTVDELLALDEKMIPKMRMRGISSGKGKTYEFFEKVREVEREKRIVMVFLSHPMYGLTFKEIYEIRKKAENCLRKKYGNITIIDNIHHRKPEYEYSLKENAERVWHLGESIRIMSEADGVYFCPGWKDAKGCRIEYEICKTYDIRILD